MPAFKDTEGRTWTVRLNVATIKRVRELAGVDLANWLRDDVHRRLADDVVLLVDVLFAAVKPEADARSVSDEAFGQAFDGDVLEAATGALVEALLDFFPQLKRDLLRKAYTKTRTRLAAAQQELTPGRLEQVTDEIAERAVAQLTSGRRSTSSPALSASSPTT